jgi:hypothetical protein
VNITTATAHSDTQNNPSIIPKRRQNSRDEPRGQTKTLPLGEGEMLLISSLFVLLVKKLLVKNEAV